MRPGSSASGRHFASAPHAVISSAGSVCRSGRRRARRGSAAGYLGVIGWVDPGDEPTVDGRGLPGHPDGRQRRDPPARSRTRRSVLDARSIEPAPRLLGCEDEDMYHRLLALGARGAYAPDLVIYHHVPAARLTKTYFRRWCFWRGVSLGVMDRDRPAPVRYLAGVPRYRIGRAVSWAGFSRRHILSVGRGRPTTPQRIRT